MPLPRRTVLLSAAALLATPALALRYEDQNFADTLSLGGASLVLNGAGRRRAAIFNLYLAALYVRTKSHLPEAIYAEDGPKRLEMRIVIGLDRAVSTQEFVKAIHVGVGRNCDEAEQAAVAERVKRFNAHISEVGEVRKGDVLLIDYLPAQGGTVLTVNGKVYGKPVEGQDFYTAFLKVFLGDKPSDKRLRAGLLGQ